MRVGVFGAGGRMGSTVCQTVAADPSLALAAAVDPAYDGKSLDEISATSGSGLQISGSQDAMVKAGVEVAVDFTIAASAVENIRYCIEEGIHAVVGTTGISPDQLEGIKDLLGRDPRSNVLIAPNFAIGAVLMMKFARQAATWLPDAEIIELHHRDKKDAPSGTALRTLEEIALGRKVAAVTRTESHESLPGARGGEKEGVRIHSVRLPGLVAHQEVIFGGQGQTLTIRHDSTDRTSFMPGVILAVKSIAGLKGLTIGLDSLLEVKVLGLE